MIKSNSQGNKTTLSLAKENQKYRREGDFLVAEIEERTGKAFRGQDVV